MQDSNGSTDGSPAARIGLAARVPGIPASPRDTFERVAADPRRIAIPALGVGAADLFHIRWVMNLAIGLAVLRKRRTTAIATALYGKYAGIALIIAVLRTNIGF